MSDTFASYPYLTREEFAEAAHLLDRRYRQATLGPLRRRWRLNVHRAFDLTYTSPTDDGGQSTYVQIVRPLETVGADDDDDALAAALDRALSLRGTGVRAVEGGDASMADEDGDEVRISPLHTISNSRPCRADGHHLHLNTRLRSSGLLSPNKPLPPTLAMSRTRSICIQPTACRASGSRCMGCRPASGR